MKKVELNSDGKILLVIIVFFGFCGVVLETYPNLSSLEFLKNFELCFKILLGLSFNPFVWIVGILYMYTDSKRNNR